VTTLARNLRMGTVAEGIETREHLTTVSGAGCDEVQGFYFSRPVPASEVSDVLALCRLKCLVTAPPHAASHPPPKQRRRTRATR
jgi:predicted signal transduction protein with EAL and GGDEF domain